MTMFRSIIILKKHLEPSRLK